MPLVEKVNRSLKSAIRKAACAQGESRVTAAGGADFGLSQSMAETPNNVIEFPLNRRPQVSGCPQCGRRGGVWQIGRLLWGYCDTHQVRWVVADLKSIRLELLDRERIRKGLDMLSSYVEVTR